MPVHTKLYETLGVSPTASAAEIKKAFRTLAAKWHPDKNQGDKAAEAKFKEASSAYDVLSDVDKRKNYDEFGPESLSSGFDAARARAWKQAGGGFPGGGGGFPGGGFPGGGFPGGGQGFPGFGGGVEFDLNDILGGFAGGGRSRGRRAPREATTELELDLAQALAGVEVTVAGQRVRIPQGADTGNSVKVDTAEGPVRIKIHVRPHPSFTRHGLDLTLKLPVTLAELANGASVEVPTPDGPVSLKIPPRTKNGGALRLKGRGVTRKEHRGDLYVELQAKLPDTFDDAFVEACKATEALYTTPVRDGLRL